MDDDIYDEDDLYDDYDDYDDHCYECGGYGDDYYIDDSGELVCACMDCPFASWNRDGDD